MKAKNFTDYLSKFWESYVFKTTLALERYHLTEIPSSQVSFIHEQIEFMEIVNSILGSQNSISIPRFIAAAERHSVVI